MSTRGVMIHETAIVDEGAEISEGSRIWHFSHVSHGARLGQNCVVGQNVFIGPGVVIGNGVKIQNNVSVYSGVTIEDNVFLGPSCVFTNVINPRAHVERKDEFRATNVAYGATIGANATIICGHDVGKFAMVGAGAVVTSNVRPHDVVIGVPALHHAWACECGVILHGSGAQQCGNCKKSYVLSDDSCKLMENP